MDREWGSKPGSGGAASAQNEAINRHERLRRLALETIDLAKDPYFMRNHLGRFRLPPSFPPLSNRSPRTGLSRQFDVFTGPTAALACFGGCSYKCKLYLTLHNNKANYLAHT
ncbi:hypothetical protein ACJRO7_022404 [Eucalyptus globulus]|uniref:Uncharacterized protein n=1 Tax=Eucalyptus globulus TaxID=34317 RepID=A0ABD3K210_EUCGL